MINGELVKFEYCFNQLGLDGNGNETEHQFIIFRAIDGISGRFYQIVLNDKLGEERAWSFTTAEDLVPMINKFINWADKIDEM